MLLHTDIPTRSQISRLLDSRDPYSVSIYIPTEPAGDWRAERIAYRNAVSEALDQLRATDITRADLESITEELEDLGGDDAFWAYQAHTLVVLATPRTVLTFRLANRLTPVVEVSDRFHVKPLLRAQTFPQVALVLALSQGSVRLIEIEPDMAPSEVRVPDMPTDVASAAGKASITDRSPSGAVQGSEGQKLRMRQYCRMIDHALRQVLGSADLPLILAAAEPIESIYRSVNTYPHLAGESIIGNPEGEQDAALGTRAREILDGLYAAELRDLHERFERAKSLGRATSDAAEVARAATFGLVDTLFVDIDAVVSGTVDESTGELIPGEAGSGTYGVIDEVSRRAWQTDSRVLAVRGEDVPGGGPAAAILRYAPFSA